MSPEYVPEIKEPKVEYSKLAERELYKMIHQIYGSQQIRSQSIVQI